MKAGHVFTIEPMVNEGEAQNVMWKDDWTATNRFSTVYSSQQMFQFFLQTSPLSTLVSVKAITHTSSSRSKGNY